MSSPMRIRLTFHEDNPLDRPIFNHLATIPSSHRADILRKVLVDHFIATGGFASVAFADDLNNMSEGKKTGATAPVQVSTPKTAAAPVGVPADAGVMGDPALATFGD